MAALGIIQIIAALGDSINDIWTTTDTENNIWTKIDAGNDIWT